MSDQSEPTPEPAAPAPAEPANAEPAVVVDLPDTLVQHVYERKGLDLDRGEQR